MNKLIISKEINHSKIISDLDFLTVFTKFAKSNNWRIVVSGGYGLDGYLGVITRSHGDLDLIIYGQNSRTTALNKLTTYLSSTIVDATVIAKQEPFYLELDINAHNFGGNFYYVETVDDPFINIQTIIKDDGTMITNSLEDFPPPSPGKLDNLLVEVQDQGAHLGDILQRRENDTALSKHDQDIVNIQESFATK